VRIPSIKSRAGWPTCPPSPADFGARADRPGDSAVYLATDGGASRGTRLRVGANKKERLDALRFVWTADPPLRQSSRPHVVGWRCARFDRVVVGRGAVHGSAHKRQRAVVELRKPLATPRP